MKQNTVVYKLICPGNYVTSQHDDERSGRILTDCCVDGIYMFSRVHSKASS